MAQNTNGCSQSQDIEPLVDNNNGSKKFSVAKAEMNKTTMTNKKHAGISLLEMLISLGIFAVIVLPLVSLPIKAKEQNNTTLNTDKLTTQISDVLLNTMATDVNSAVSFLPFVCLNKDANNNCVTGTTSTSYFSLGYPSTNRSADSQVVYRIRSVNQVADLGDVNLTSSSSTETRTVNTQTAYQIQRLALTPNTTLSSIATSSHWKTLGGSNTTKTLNFSPIKFVYLQNGKCISGFTTKPQEADSMAIVNSNATCANGLITGNFQVSIGNTTTKLAPFYYKLGSQQATTDTASKVYAFPVVLKDYNTLSAALSGTNYPVSRDIGYDYQTGDIIIATDDGASAGRKFYINKCKPEVGCTNVMNNTALDNYSKDFPVVLTTTTTTNTPGYPGTDYSFVSATADADGNIYILATNSANAKILKFTSQAVFDGAFFVNASAKAITFDPSTPDELLALVQSGGNTSIQSYLIDPATGDNATAVSPTATASISITGTVAGFDLDPFTNRFIVNNTTGSTWIIPHSIDSDVNSRTIVQSPPVDSGGYISTYTPLTYTGITFDPINNRYYTTIKNSNSLSEFGKIVSVGNNMRLDRNYQ